MCCEVIVKMDKLCCFMLILSISYGSCGVVIPEQLTSLLFNGYGSIPPIKKGTDSRIGFGYAFGNHADFQVLFELGPQTNTIKLDQEPFSAIASSSKRQTPLNTFENRGETDASKYLKAWAAKMRNTAQQPGSSIKVPNLEDPVVELVMNQQNKEQPSTAETPDTEVPNSGDGQKVEDAKKTEEEQKNTELEAEKIKEDLSNVELN